MVCHHGKVIVKVRRMHNSAKLPQTL